ncbi:MAG: hypothetical protein N2053_07815, partial [Chitinispirillaceae bacterium]|nr:hypothetical protein [Chitinispirillaceae bacterium]
ASVIGENTFIPLRRLQRKDVSRCLALFVPDAICRKNSGVTVRYSGAWLFSFLWASSFLENNTPLYLNYGSSSGLFDGLIFPKVSKDTIFDAYLHGINLLAPDVPLTPRVINENAESPYGNLFFNLIVNRTARLAANWISREGINNSACSSVLDLEEYLKKELIPDGILSNTDALMVETTEDGVVVTVDSETKISNFNIKFQFSFGK